MNVCDIHCYSQNSDSKCTLESRKLIAAATMCHLLRTFLLIYCQSPFDGCTGYCFLFLVVEGSFCCLAFDKGRATVELQFSHVGVSSVATVAFWVAWFKAEVWSVVRAEVSSVARTETCSVNWVRWSSFISKIHYLWRCNLSSWNVAGLDPNKNTICSYAFKKTSACGKLYNFIYLSQLCDNCRWLH